MLQTLTGGVKRVECDARNIRQVIDGLDELRFNLLRSGLYGFIFSTDGTLAWQSPSAEILLQEADVSAVLRDAANQALVPVPGHGDLDRLLAIARGK